MKCEHQHYYCFLVFISFQTPSLPTFSYVQLDHSLLPLKRISTLTFHSVSQRQRTTNPSHWEKWWTAIG